MEPELKLVLNKHLLLSVWRMFLMVLLLKYSRYSFKWQCLAGAGAAAESMDIGQGGAGAENK